MINNNKNEFMNTVRMKADSFKQRAFEAYTCSFLKSIIKESSIVDVSNQLDLNDESQMIDMVKGTISSISKDIINGSTLKDETSALYDVNIAGELTNPSSLAEKAAKNIAEAVTSETDDRIKQLEAQFDTGKFKANDIEEVIEKVDESFESIKLNNYNNANLSKEMKYLLSVEGQELIESIKDDVLGMINETEAKNSIVREAISDINERKDQIEEEVNGDDSDKKDEDNTESDNENGEESSSEENSSQEVEEASNETLRRCRNNFRTGRKSNLINIDDLVYVTSARVNNSSEELEVGKDYDKISFSREEAERMLNEFREAEDGIDLDKIDNDENILSVSDNEDTDTGDIDPNTNPDAESAESSWDDDDNKVKVIEVDTSKFDYGTDSNPEIEADEISEEALAKRILPLSLNKFRDNTAVVNTSKFACYLAVKPDHGQEFFNNINGRIKSLSSMMSTEGIDDENDPINRKLLDTIDTCNTVKDKVHDLTEDLGILGILDGKFQRTDDATSNAVKSLANGVLLSKESLEENEYASILKIALSLDDLISDIANGIDVSGNRQKVGDLEELLNEKIVNIEDPVARDDIEAKVKALHSIESICPFEDVINMQVFVSKYNDKVDKITLNSLKDIDAYGYCYVDEIAQIEKDIKDKYESFMATNKGDHSINVDIHQLVEYVAEEKDTTKINTNLYEMVISKLVENKTIENSIEALFYRNKAKTIVTGLIAADKMNYLSDQDIEDLKYKML